MSLNTPMTASSSVHSMHSPVQPCLSRSALAPLAALLLSLPFFCAVLLTGAPPASAASVAT